MVTFKTASFGEQSPRSLQKEACKQTSDWIDFRGFSFYRGRENGRSKDGDERTHGNNGGSRTEIHCGAPYWIPACLRQFHWFLPCYRLEGSPSLSFSISYPFKKKIILEKMQESNFFFRFSVLLMFGEKVVSCTKPSSFAKGNNGGFCLSV